MELYTLLMHTENAFDSVIALGHQGYVQFNEVYDEDNSPNGLYAKRLQMCIGLQRLVDYIQEQLNQTSISKYFYPDVDTDQRPTEKLISDYETILTSIHAEIFGITERYNALHMRRSYFNEWYHSLLNADKFLWNGQLLLTESTVMLLLKDLSHSEPGSMQLNFILGSIEATKLEALQTLLYRIFGRNLIMRSAEIPELLLETPGAQPQMKKYTILLITPSSLARTKLLKCCQAFHVTIFECPEGPSARMHMIISLQSEISDIGRVVEETETLRFHILSIASTDLFIYSVNLKKARRAYDLLNRLQVFSRVDHQKYLYCNVFVPKKRVGEVREVLDSSVPQSAETTFFPSILLKGNSSSPRTQPTYYELNKFTNGFQNLIDAYGTADYRELNPAPYTIITFPFLFAIMFGDVGHGFILLLFAILLICKEKDILNFCRTSKKDMEILNILFSGRYIILLMGIFSIYIGFIYNDIVSKSFNIGSSWQCRYNQSTLNDMTSEYNLDPSSPNFYNGNPYPFGVDAIWDIAGEDSINYFNSLKMKLAIILGISQMMFGLTLAAVNSIILDRICDLYLVVLPQIIFMTCLFCYLVFLIFFKWLFFGGHKTEAKSSACAPSVLITFIDMMLLKTTPAPGAPCVQGMFPFERILEYVLLIVAFASVPVLLAGKPIYLARQQKKLTKTRESDANEEVIDEMNRSNINAIRSSLRYSYVEGQGSTTHMATEETEFDLAEICIHSGIHTIESVLGSVSHTASYLRLWALSLAHDQLSGVLWNMIMAKGLHNKLPLYFGAPLLCVCFFVWAILTICILVMMEGLSAFLHTLRLHWVEFQSKFFSGSGERFVPFYFPLSTMRD